MARPWINLSKYGGYAEAKLAYDALVAGHNDEALRWSRDATHMQPKITINWFNMGIAYDRLGRNLEAKTAFKRANDLDPAADLQNSSADGGSGK